MALPTYVNKGTVVETTTGTLTPGLPSGWAQDDILIIVHFNRSGPGTPPSGYAEIVSGGAGTGSGGSRIQVYWKRATSSESAPTLGAEGNAQAQMIAIRDCKTSGDPYELAAGGTDTGPPLSTSSSWTTGGPDRLLVVCVGRNGDNDLAQFSNWACTNSSSPTERVDEGFTNGTGGGIAAATAGAATAGSYGPWTADMGLSNPMGWIRFSLLPAADVVSSSFTADAVILRNQSSSFTADAVLKRNDQPGSFSADAVLLKGQAGSITADAFFVVTVLDSLTADADLFATISGSFTANAVLLRGQSGSLTSDALLLVVVSGFFSADADLKREQVGSFAGDGVLLRAQAGSFAADAVLIGAGAGSFNANAVLLAGQGGSATADAILRSTQAGSFTADAVLLRAISGSLTADAALLATIAGSFVADSILKATQPGSLTGDAWLVIVVSESITADADLKKTISGSFTANAVLLKAQSGSLTSDAEIETPEVFAGGFTGQVGIAASRPGTFVPGRVGDVLHFFTADAALVSTTTSSITADAFIEVVHSTFPANAILLRVQSGSFTANAILKRNQTGSFLADAVVSLGVPVFGSFTANAVKKKTTERTLNANAVVRDTRLTLDAFIRPPYQIQHARTGPHTGFDKTTDHTIAHLFDRYLRGDTLHDVLVDFDARLTARERHLVSKWYRVTAHAAIKAFGLVGSFTANAFFNRAGSFLADARINPMFLARAWFTDPAVTISDSIAGAVDWGISTAVKMAFRNTSTLTSEVGDPEDYWGETDKTGWAKFTLASPATVRVSTDYTGNDSVIQLFGPGSPTDGNRIDTADDTDFNPAGDESLYGSSESITVALAAGTYYVEVFPFDPDDADYNIVLTMQIV